MNHSEKESMLQMMKAAIDLETEKATQEGIIDRYQQKMQEIQPQFNAEEYPDKPLEPVYESEKLTSIFNVIPLVVLTIFSTLLSLIGMGGLIESIVDWDLTGVVFSLLFLSPLLILLIVFSIYKRKVKARNEERQRKYNRAYAVYESKANSIMKQNTLNENKYQDNLTSWKDKYGKDMSMLQKTLSKTMSLLNQLYSKDLFTASIATFPHLQAFMNISLRDAVTIWPVPTVHTICTRMRSGRIP